MTTPLTSSKRQTVQFDSSLFPELNLIEYESPWTVIGFQHLAEGEGQEMLGLFISLIRAPGQIIDEDELLLVKAENGLLRRVYGPCVFQSGSGLMVKLGSNSFPLKVIGRDLICGDLQGDFEVDPHSEPHKPVSYLRLSALEPRIDWLVNVRLMEGLTASDLKQALRQGADILPYFQAPPGKGEDTPILKMQELGAGEFAVEKVKSLTTQKGRECWLYLLTKRTTMTVGSKLGWPSTLWGMIAFSPSGISGVAKAPSISRGSVRRDGELSDVLGSR